MIPARVLEIISSIAQKHETTPQLILRGDKTAETVQARRELIEVLAGLPKPSGHTPTKAEIARWLNIDPASVSRKLA